VGSVARALRDYLWATYAGAVALVVGAGIALVVWDPFALAHRALWPGVALFATLAFLAEWQVLPVTALLWWSLDSARYVAALLTFPWPVPATCVIRRKADDTSSQHRGGEEGDQEATPARVVRSPSPRSPAP